MNTTPEQYQEFYNSVPDDAYRSPQLDSVITEADGELFLKVQGSFAPPPPPEGAATEAKQDVQIAQWTSAVDGSAVLQTKDLNVAAAQDNSLPFYVTADPAQPVPTTDKNIPLAQDGTAPFYVTSAGGAVATAALQSTGNSYLGTINVNTSAVSTNTGTSAQYAQYMAKAKISQFTIASGGTFSLGAGSFYFFFCAITATGSKATNITITSGTLTAMESYFLTLTGANAPHINECFQMANGYTVKDILNMPVATAKTIRNDEAVAITLFYMTS